MTNRIYTSIIIGAGFSGIAMAIKLKEQGLSNFVILEKAREIGGTWRENTYPGAECDIPSALYSYSFEPWPDWEYKWSMQPQILAYIHHVVKKYDLHKHIQLGKEMWSAEWEDKPGLWTVANKDGTTYQGKTLITAIGQLHHPSIPKFKGQELFKGRQFHSARWDHSVSLAGKTVGVIGNAASATQFIPEIAKTAAKVVVFQRSANWMLPKQDRAYKNWEKKLVRRFPLLLKLYRTRIWLLGGGLFFLMKKGNAFLRKVYERQSINYIKKYIKDPEIVQQLTPTYPLGAKRVLFSDTYYAALARPNVALVTGGIQEVTSKGVVSGDGVAHEVEVLIYATGFTTNPFLLGLAITGKDSLSIQTAWKDGPTNYLGMTVSNFPNLFMMYGPNTNLGHNSILIMSEAQARYITKCVKAIMQNKWKSMDVRPAAMRTYHQTIQERLKKMIWASIEDSWYKSAKGNIPNNYPGRTMEYMRRTKQVDFDDYLIREE